MDRPHVDLNDLVAIEPPEPHHRDHVPGDFEVVLRNLKGRFVDLLDEARRDGLVCTGVFYRLTEPEVLESLATLPTSIVVQKDGCWRAAGDSMSQPGWKHLLRSDYDDIAGSGEQHPLFQRQHCPSPLGDVGLLEGQTISGIRCFGLANDSGADEKSPVPILHHKFVIFSELTDAGEPEPGDVTDPSGNVTWRPRILWTGSYNPTRLASRSLENAVIIRRKDVAVQFLLAWAKIMAISEPLDWTDPGLNPQWNDRT